MASDHKHAVNIGENVLTIHEQRRVASSIGGYCGVVTTYKTRSACTAPVSRYARQIQCPRTPTTSFVKVIVLTVCS